MLFIKKIFDTIKIVKRGFYVKNNWKIFLFSGILLVTVFAVAYGSYKILDKHKNEVVDVDKLGRELYKKTLVSGSTGGAYITYMYQDNLVTYDTLPLVSKLKIAYVNTGKDLEQLKEKDLTKSYQEIFGHTVPSWDGLDTALGLDCNFEGFKRSFDTCDCLSYPDVLPNRNDYLFLNSTILEDEDIILDVSFLGLDIKGSNVNVKLYGDPNYQKQVAEMPHEGDSVLYSEEDLFSRFNDNAGRFKVVFKKNKNGDYYWYSSELR